MNSLPSQRLGSCVWHALSGMEPVRQEPGVEISGHEDLAVPKAGLS